MEFIRKSKKTIKIVSLVLIATLGYFAYTYISPMLDPGTALERLMLDSTPIQTYVDEEIIITFDLRENPLNYLQSTVLDNGDTSLIVDSFSVSSDNVEYNEYGHIMLKSFFTPTDTGFKFISLHPLPEFDEGSENLQMTPDPQHKYARTLIDEPDLNWSCGGDSEPLILSFSGLYNDYNREGSYVGLFFIFNEIDYAYENLFKERQTEFSITVDGYYIIEYTCNPFQRYIINGYN